MRRLRLEREDRGWSRSELARRARMSAPDIGKIESGRLNPYPSQLTKIAEALGVDSDVAEALLEEVASHA